jgi:hypothetical protein
MMTNEELMEHLHVDHGIDKKVAYEVIGVALSEQVGVFNSESYLRGFHDGMHGRVDADDLEGVGHG